MIKNNRGFTLIEAVVSIFIITAMISATLAIVYQMKNQSIASERKLLAMEVAKDIKKDIENTLLYTTVKDAVLLNQDTYTSINCSNSIVNCELIQNNDFNNKVTITFLQPNAYNQIYFQVEINYFKDRNIMIEGVIYE